MFSEIYNYGIRNPKLVSSDGVSKTDTVRAYLRLSKGGEFETTEVVDKSTKNNAIVPDVGNWASNISKEVPFVNSVSKVIPNYYNPSEEAYKKTLNAHNNWLKYMEEANSELPQLEPVAIFIKKLEKDKKLQELIKETLESHKVKGTEKISFKVNGKYILDYIPWKEYIKNLICTEIAAETKRYISSISGKEFVGVATPAILNAIKETKTDKFSPANTGSGVYLASYKPASFRHYGLEENDGKESMHIAQDEIDVINNTLKYLISSPDHYNSKFDLVYWYSDDAISDIIKCSLELKDDDEFSDDSIDENEANYILRDLLNAANNGTKPIQKYDASYNMLNFEVTSKGRCLLHNNKKGNYNELSEGLFEWYKESQLGYNIKKNNIGYVERPLRNIYNILFVLLDHPDGKASKIEKINKEFGQNKRKLLDSVYFKKQLSPLFVHRAISRANNDKINQKEIAHELVQILKVYLIRESGEDNMASKTLNKDYDSTSYQLGRYFSVCEKLQLDSSNGKTSTIGTLFEGAQKSPDKIYPKLVNLSKVYIERFNNKGAAIYYDQLLTEIGGKIEAENLKRMDTREQAEFILGYYQQKTELWKKREDDKEEK